jgi:hypothetical protein
MLAYAKTTNSFGTCEHQLTSEGIHKIKYLGNWLTVNEGLTVESFRHYIQHFLVLHGFTVDEYKEMNE